MESEDELWYDINNENSIMVVRKKPKDLGSLRQNKTKINQILHYLVDFFMVIGRKIKSVGNFIQTKFKMAPLKVRVVGSVVGVVLIFIISFLVWHGGLPGQAASYGWLQSTWSGGASTTTTATHANVNDRTGWLSFFSKDANLSTANDELNLTLIARTIRVQTLDADFLSGTLSNAYVSGGSVIMFKPSGATCATSTECVDNYCASDGTCFNCGVDTVQYEGGPYNADGTSTSTTGYYRTVLIGDQCWLKDNLNVGTMIGSKLADATTPQNQTSASSSIEKYCYTYVTQGNASQITSGTADCAIYGAFYQWPEAVQYSNNVTLTTGTTVASGNIQGICPTGWHIPSDTEYSTLSTYLGGDTVSGGALKATGTTYWTTPNTGATNSSGFTALGAGFRNTNGSFSSRSPSINFWSTLPGVSTNAWSRSLHNSNTTLSRTSDSRAFGWSVRCLQGF